MLKFSEIFEFSRENSYSERIRMVRMVRMVRSLVDRTFQLWYSGTQLIEGGVSPRIVEQTRRHLTSVVATATEEAGTALEQLGPSGPRKARALLEAALRRRMNHSFSKMNTFCNISAIILEISGNVPQDLAKFLQNLIWIFRVGKFRLNFSRIEHTNSKNCWEQVMENAKFES